VRESQYGKEWRLLVEQTLFANSGDSAPNFALTDIKGDSVVLEKYKGKYVILDFWASWCRPCRADLPYLGKVYDKYKDKQEGLEIISISIDNNYALWTETVFKEYMPWVNVIDNTDKTYSIARLYNVGFIPASFLIDPNGKIMDTNIRGAKWDSRLQEIFVK
jgi:peroxiredoxin